MKLLSTLAVLFTLLSMSKANVTNPFTNAFAGGQTTTVTTIGSSSLPNFTSVNQTVAQPQVQPVLPQVSNTVTNVPVSAPAAPLPVNTSHTHPTPNFPPPPPPAPMTAHAHGPQTPLPPVPRPGFPHVHSGHPYIAPAVAPQRMTYQQIIEYLTNSGGLNLNNILSNGSGNFLVQCKAYCDTLPPSPVCDASNVLYRNECEAKCVHKTVSTNNLRYGICCCDDNSFQYEAAGSVYYSNTATQNLCISTCIFSCLGGEAPIEAQHSADSMELVKSSQSCLAIN